MNTIHSIIRANERAGWNYDEAVRFTELAIRNGRRAKELPLRERRFMESRESGPAITSILYNGYIFIVNDDVCITMYLAPEWFLKKRYYDGKKKVRNVKKYLRYHCSYGMEAA